MNRIHRSIWFFICCLCFACLATGTALAASTPWTVKNGKIYENGKLIFPRGFYYVSYYPGEKAGRLTALNSIAQAGYNFMTTPLDGSDKPFLDAAASKGVRVAMEFNDDPTYLIKQFGTHPALSWIVAFDDVDAYVNGVPRYSPATVGQKSSYYKSLAPNNLTYISGGYPSRIRNYLGTADTIGFQTYPIPYESLSTVTSSYLGPIVNDFRLAGQPLIANLQTFAWNGTARWPTSSEVRNMTYQALVAGVQGIMYYTYYDQQNTLAGKTLWTEMTKIGKELKTLQRFLLRGARKSLPAGQTETYAASWKIGTELVVVVVNASSNVSKTVSISLNENLTGTMTNLFSSRSGVLSLKGKTVTGTLPKESVQVYKLGVY